MVLLLLLLLCGVFDMAVVLANACGAPLLLLRSYCCLCCCSVPDNSVDGDDDGGVLKMEAVSTCLPR